ncbi:hypothetical protein J6590_097468 [Homalodisca vitripennis]|nr:hypothetical protein J6590_097468 [Homalodisca vitripennis]
MIPQSITQQINVRCLTFIAMHTSRGNQRTRRSDTTSYEGRCRRTDVVTPPPPTPLTTTTPNHP